MPNNMDHFCDRIQAELDKRDRRIKELENALEPFAYFNCYIRHDAINNRKHAAEVLFGETNPVAPKEDGHGA